MIEYSISTKGGINIENNNDFVIELQQSYGTEYSIKTDEFYESDIVLEKRPIFKTINLNIILKTINTTNLNKIRDLINEGELTLKMTRDSYIYSIDCDIKSITKKERFSKKWFKHSVILKPKSKWYGTPYTNTQGGLGFDIKDRPSGGKYRGIYYAFNRTANPGTRDDNTFNETDLQSKNYQQIFLTSNNLSSILTHGTYIYIVSETNQDGSIKKNNGSLWVVNSRNNDVELNFKINNQGVYSLDDNFRYLSSVYDSDLDLLLTCNVLYGFRNIQNNYGLHIVIYPKTNTIPRINFNKTATLKRYLYYDYA